MRAHAGPEVQNGAFFRGGGGQHASKESSRPSLFGTWGIVVRYRPAWTLSYGSPCVLMLARRSLGECLVSRKSEGRRNHGISDRARGMLELLPPLPVAGSDPEVSSFLSFAGKVEVLMVSKFHK